MQFTTVCKPVLSESDFLALKLQRLQGHFSRWGEVLGNWGGFGRKMSLQLCAMTPFLSLQEKKKRGIFALRVSRGKKSDTSV